jgi:hypothetical protein
MKARSISTVLLLGLFNVAAWSQPATGAISGRVMAEDGQPIPRVTVSLQAIGKTSRSVSVSVDDEGNFRAEGLDAASYAITATAPGYVMRPQIEMDASAVKSPNYNHIGDVVTITMIKGGVITGRVTNALGEPVISVPVVVARVRDEGGRELPAPEKINTFPQRQTDDRGVYRYYGLAPGSYIVSAGGSGFSTRPTPFDGRMLTYHPSATRDTATEVVARSGAEATGVDIRYRGERGYIISGKITGLQGPGGFAQIIVRKAGSDLVIATTSLSSQKLEDGYAIYGLPNGEYEVIAARDFSDDDNAYISSTRRAQVNGRDVSGIDLALTPMAALVGKTALEKSVEAQKCEDARNSRLTEVVIRVRRDRPGEKDDTPAFPFWKSPEGVVAEDGAFSIRGLKAGRYRLEPLLPDAGWYVKAMKLSGAPPATGDIARSGLTLKSGERLSGAQLTLGASAAGLKGKVTAAAGTKLPKRLRAYLAPAEPDAGDDALRFAETVVEGGGEFSFNHLAPGKYWLLAKPIPDAEPNDKPARPVAWEAAERAKLLREAEAAKIMVELKPCQRRSDFALPYGK